MSHLMWFVVDAYKSSFFQFRLIRKKVTCTTRFLCQGRQNKQRHEMLSEKRLLCEKTAWAARDYGRRALNKVIKFKNCKEGENCLGTEGVLRVSLGCFLFYFVIDKWHSGWWSAKLIMWPALTIIPFLLPSTIILLYGELAHFGAGVFLLIQLISVINLISWLNEYYQSQKDAERCHVLCIVGVIFMYIWYAPDSSCLPNIFFITWTLFLIQLMTCIALHPKSFVVALLAMVIATFSTGIDSQCFRFKKDVCSEGEDQEDGAMYFAMQLIGWNTHHPMTKQIFFNILIHTSVSTGLRLLRILTFSWFRWMIDVGWTSTWVRIVNEWVAVCVYS
ncbi:hypothetical protein BRARA_G00683 [Brassica rapa]|uniref:Uncharacterized protein n=1 Tax=Brassica campestris TaxID=3711 RepID=A0A397YMU8_BRACM|nr:hypothetical protein BRARA_G00683 [Brassica rapa]